MEKVKLALLKENPELAAFVHYAMDENCQFFYSPGQSPQSLSQDMLVLESTYDLFRKENRNVNSSSVSPDKIVVAHDDVSYDSSLTKSKTRKILKVTKSPFEDKSIDQYVFNNPVLSNIIGNCGAIKKIKRDLYIVSDKDCKVLFCGESGTGKSKLAAILHKLSARRNEEFVNVNIGAMQKDLIESNLFGTVKGAYTDARDRKGLLTIANNGTIFLDEIGEMPLNCQTKLLHALDEGCFRKVGSDVEEKTNARFVFATNANLKELVKKKLFREDLYWRIAEFSLNVPPLRERGNDIVLIAEFFLDMINFKNKDKVRYFTENAKDKLMNYYWPGNIRELKSCINISAIFSSSEKIDAENIRLENEN